MKSNLYINIWERALPIILKKLKSSIENDGKTMKYELNSNDFKVVGNRKSYTFTIEYQKGNTKRSGTAVGRDLQQVLKNSQEFQAFAIDKTVVLHLSKQFIMIVSAI